MAEDENKEEIDREQRLAQKRIARAKLRSRLILGGIFGSVTCVVLGLFGIHMPAAHLAISAVIVLLMSGFILYDTSAIINGGETNYIMATIRLYLNILNLFTALLHLLGAMNDD